MRYWITILLLFVPLNVHALVLGTDKITISSIQSGTVSILAADASGTANITPVNDSYSVIIPNGKETSLATEADWNTAITSLDFIDGSQVNAVRAALNASQGTVSVNFMVLEFKPDGVKSIQKGSITITNTNNSATDTINSVDTTKSILFDNGISLAQSAVCDDAMVRLTLTNDTTVTADRDSTDNSTTIHYTVVEFR